MISDPESVARLMLKTVLPLIDHEDELSITVDCYRDYTGLRLFVAPQDVHNVVGSHGNLIEAIRSVLVAITSHSGRRFRLTVEKRDAILNAPQPRYEGHDGQPETVAAVFAASPELVAQRAGE